MQWSEVQPINIYVPHFTALQKINQIPIRSAQFDPFTLTQPTLKRAMELETSDKKIR
jgi:hypothetical protein